jgi:hypothetical protein
LLLQHLPAAAPCLLLLFLLLLLLLLLWPHATACYCEWLLRVCIIHRGCHRPLLWVGLLILTTIHGLEGTRPQRVLWLEHGCHTKACWDWSGTS